MDRFPSAHLLQRPSFPPRYSMLIRRHENPAIPGHRSGRFRGRFWNSQEGPIESGRVYAEGGGDFSNGSPLTAKSNGPPKVELDLGSAELGPAPLGRLDPSPGPLPDQLPFQFGHSGDDGEGEPPGRCARVDPIMHGDEVDSLCPEVVEGHDEVSDAPGEAVEPPIAVGSFGRGFRFPAKYSETTIVRRGGNARPPHRFGGTPCQRLKRLSARLKKNLQPASGITQRARVPNTDRQADRRSHPDGCGRELL
jgi:hypothetical protein